MKVYILWDVNHAYGSESLVGVFPTTELAMQYAGNHKTKTGVSMFTDGPRYSERIINYVVREYEVKESSE